MKIFNNNLIMYKIEHFYVKSCIKWLFLANFLLFLCIFFAYKPKTTRHNYICKTKRKGFKMLKKFKNWLIENNYKINTAKDYQDRIERLCKQENISLETLVLNI